MAEQIDKIEADFFQFYHVDIENVENSRLERLVQNLPAESRLVRELAPEANWDFRDEIASRTLYNLEAFMQIFVGANSKKGHRPKFEKLRQLQPEAVEEAKKRAVKMKNEAERAKIQGKTGAPISFWEKHNNRVKKM